MKIGLHDSGKFRKETWEEYCKRLGIEVKR